MLCAGLAWCLVACDDADDRSCAAVMSYAEPSLTITDVLGPTGASLDTVRLDAWRVDGRPTLRELRFAAERDGEHAGATWTPGHVTSDAHLHTGLSISPSGDLMCHVPCGFGSMQGSVEVVVTAADGSRGTSTAEATYRSQHPGCGGAEDDGTDVVVRLRS